MRRVAELKVSGFCNEESCPRASCRRPSRCLSDKAFNCLWVPGAIISVFEMCELRSIEAPPTLRESRAVSFPWLARCGTL